LQQPAALSGFPAEPPGPGSPPELQATATYVPVPVSEHTLEFDIPEESWSNFFEATEPENVASPNPDREPVFIVTGEAEEPTLPDAEAEAGPDAADQAGLYRTLPGDAGSLNLDDDADWQALLEEVQDDDALRAPVYVISGEPAQDPGDALLLSDPPWDDPLPAGAAAPARMPADFAADLPGTATAPAGPDFLAADQPFIWRPPAPPTTAESGRHWGYTAGAVLAALLLVVQLLHHQRDELATIPTLTEALQRTYNGLGLPLWPAWDLRAYELRNSEAVADRSSPGALDILARIAVVGNDPVGLPLVRVTLRDRFAQSLGTRVFQPEDYLGRNPRPREPMSPGTLIPVEISLRDLGADAQGFDVDVCLMTRRDGITCRGERGPFVR
jgi:hypothetical protein